MAIIFPYIIYFVGVFLLLVIGLWDNCSASVPNVSLMMLTSMLIPLISVCLTNELQSREGNNISTDVDTPHPHLHPHTHTYVCTYVQIIYVTNCIFTVLANVACGSQELQVSQSAMEIVALSWFKNDIKENKELYRSK